MNGYDNWKTATPEDDGFAYEGGDCPVCHGGTGAACSEECDELILRVKTQRMIRGAYEAARIAVTMARSYELEGDSSLRAMLKLQAEDIGSMDTLPAGALEAAE
jgi:hypothetical protein